MRLRHDVEIDHAHAAIRVAAFDRPAHLAQPAVALDDTAQLRMRCQALLEFCIAFFAQQFLDLPANDRRFDEDHEIG